MSERSGAAPQPGDVVAGKYVLREHIGEGGMGWVFLADEPARGRRVALKLLHPALATSPGFAERLCHEAVAAGRVQHQHSIAVLDYGAAPDAPYIAMPHVRGRSLARLIDEESISVSRAIALTLQILGAVEAAHCSGVVHGDIKSDNFLVDQIDGADHVTMIDFGLARLDEQPAIIDQEDGDVFVSGTPEYMAPEIVRGGLPTRASDLYAVGVILYELLTNATPFGGGTAADVMMRHIEDAVVRPSLWAQSAEISPRLDRIVLRALAKRPDDRFSDAASFAAALNAALAAQPITTTIRSLNDVSQRRHSLRVCATPGPRQRLARGSDCTARSAARRDDREPAQLDMSATVDTAEYRAIV